MNYISVEVLQYWNFDLRNITTPVNVAVLHNYLVKSKYQPQESQFLIEGFTKGFSIGYQGPQFRSSKSSNIPFTPGVGNAVEMWNKIMLEVKEKRVAGPFKMVPYEHYIQSPIGLVPKKGNKTRLIFHLSYNFSDTTDTDQDGSLNYFMPKEICTTKYNDLDHAVINCLWLSGES